MQPLTAPGWRRRRRAPVTHSLRRLIIVAWKHNDKVHIQERTSLPGVSGFCSERVASPGPPSVALYRPARKLKTASDTTLRSKVAAAPAAAALAAAALAAAQVAAAALAAAQVAAAALAAAQLRAAASVVAAALRAAAPVVAAALRAAAQAQVAAAQGAAAAAAAQQGGRGRVAGPPRPRFRPSAFYSHFCVPFRLISRPRPRNSPKSTKSHLFFPAGPAAPRLRCCTACYRRRRCPAAARHLHLHR